MGVVFMVVRRLVCEVGYCPNQEMVDVFCYGCIVLIKRGDYLPLWLMGVVSWFFVCSDPLTYGWVEFIDLLHSVFLRAGSQVLWSFRHSSFRLKFC